MLEYQQRVVTEKIELDARLAKLEKFAASRAFTSPSVRPSEEWLLVKQLDAMRELSMVLGARISSWPENTREYPFNVIPVNMEQVLAIERGEEPFPEEVGLNLAYGRAVA